MSDRELFGGLRPPSPPEGLRQRVLDSALGREISEQPSMWQRLWEQPGLRLAWAAAVLVLVAGHGILSMPDRLGAPSVTPKVLVASASLDASTAPLVAVDRIDERHLPTF